MAVNPLKDPQFPFSFTPDNDPDRFPDTTGRIRPGDVGVRIIERQHPVPHTRAELALQAEAWRDYIAKWRIERPMNVHLSIESNGGVVYLRMGATEPESKEANPKDPRHIMLQVDIPVPSVMPDERSARWVRALVRWLVLHELDEWIVVDDKRIFDPHRDGRTPTPENS